MTQLRLCISSFLIATLCISVLPHATQAGTLKPLENYALAPVGSSFSELFSKKNLNEKLFEKTSSGEYYDTQYEGSRVTTTKGKLNLGSAVMSGTVYGSEVVSKKLYNFGTFTIKTKANSAPGMVSTIYLSSESNDGSTREEVSMELSGDNPAHVAIADYHDDAGESAEEKSETHQTEIIDVAAIEGLKSFKSTKFNTYKIEWVPGIIRWYVNGKKIAEHVDSIPTTPMKIHLTTYHTSEWENFVNSSANGAGAMVIDMLKYTPDQKGKPVALITKKMQIKGDQECRDHVNAALDQLKAEPWHYNFVVEYVDLIECVEVGSVIYVSEKPRRHTAGRPGRDDPIQFANDLVHEACHSWEYTSYIEQNPGVDDVPNEIYSGRDAEEKCLNLQVDYLRRIGAKEYADGYKDAMASEWWKVPLEDMQY